MRTYIATVTMLFDSVTISILDADTPTTVSVTRTVDSFSAHLASLAQAGIEQMFDVGPSVGRVTHGYRTAYESNNNHGANLVVFEFDYDS